MHVFLDTNIFYSDWHLKSSSMRLLFHFLNNETYALLLSNLVVEETDNLHRRMAKTAHSVLQKQANDLLVLSPTFKVEVSPFEETQTYNLQTILENRATVLYAIEYESISQSEVVKRALSSRRPFKEKEKGYRDTLIWLSLLKYLKDQEIDGEVAFISTNTSDFMNVEKTNFHADLLEDIEKAGLACRLQYFTSLPNFLQSKVDSEAHLIDLAKVETLAEDFLEFHSVLMLEALSDEQLAELEDHLLQVNGILANASPISAEIVEGMEDLHLDSTMKLDGDNVYVTCTFNLRVVSLTMDISLASFRAHKHEIAASETIYDVNTSGNLATLRAIIRPYFFASFTFNTVTQEIDGFSVDQIMYGKAPRAGKSLYRGLLRTPSTTVR